MKKWRVRGKMKSVASLDAARIKRYQNVTEVWEKHYRGWLIVFTDRRWENSIIRQGFGFPAEHIEKSWYSRHEDKEGVMQEWSNIVNNERVEGPDNVPWIIIESEARRHVDDFEGHPTPELVQSPDFVEWGKFRKD